VVPSGQQEDVPSYDGDASQHVEPSSQQTTPLLAPGPSSPQHDDVAEHKPAARK
jgi:hypothetical protein